MDTDSWHIIRVSPGKEGAVAATPHGYACYSPTVTTRVFNRRFRAWRAVSRPLLPGYLFVDTPDLRPFLNFPQAHVFGPLRNADRSFALVSRKEVEALRAMENKTRLEASQSPFQKGDLVKAREGTALEDFIGVIKRLEGLTKIVVDLSLFGRPVEVTFQPHQLVAA